MLKKITCCIFGLSSLLLVIATSCRHSTVASEIDTSVITPVTIVGVAYKPVTETIDLPGVTVFLRKSTVRSTTTGTVESISILLGDYVKKDQLLYTIRTREASALNNSLTADSTLSFRGRINICSPTSGVISSILHQNGDFVEEGDELAGISEQNSLVFILDAPFEFVRYIERNTSCKIKLPDNQIIDGKIARRLPEMDPQSQTVRFIIKPVSAGHLPANLNALIIILKGTRVKASVLPKSAVLSNEIQTEFWVMKLINDSTAIKVPVKKGFENNEEIEITEPELLPADRIILTGGYGLSDTARVIIK